MQLRKETFKVVLERYMGAHKGVEGGGHSGYRDRGVKAVAYK